MTLPAEEVDAAPLSAGDELDSVIVSPPIGGLLGTWRNQEHRLWRVESAAALPSIGLGRLARSRIERDRYREVGLLSTRGVLILPGRWQNQEEAGLAAETVALQPVSISSLSQQAIEKGWRELAGWLRTVTADAAKRNEFLLVEPGGWEATEAPFALWAIGRRKATGELLSVLESNPVPRLNVAPWNQVGEGLSGITAPATDATISVAGLALAMAASTWAVSPWHISMTYGDAHGAPIELP